MNFLIKSSPQDPKPDPQPFSWDGGPAWLASDGKVYEVDDASMHLIWLQEHLNFLRENYGLKPETLYPFNWVRIASYDSFSFPFNSCDEHVISILNDFLLIQFSR